jgi:RND family efflux transporter MFP subunit
MNKKWIWGAVGAIAVIAAGAVAVQLSNGGKTAAKPDVKAEGKKATTDTPLALAPADVALAGPASLSVTLPLSGSVEAARQATIRSRHAGIATQMTKRAGDAVRAGEVLARIDSEELRLRASEREAAVRQAQAALAVAESARNQQRSLADRGFISRAALDAVENSYVAAKSALDTAQSQLGMARAALAETALTSPISGIVARRAVEPGERVGNEGVVFVVIDPHSLEVSAQVPAERASELKVGQSAQFELESGSEARVSARLARIVPNATPGARTIEVRFALPAGTAIPAGAFLSGRLTLAERSVAVAVPRAALRTDGGGHYVWTVREGKVQRARVSVLDADATAPTVGIGEGLMAQAPVLVLRGVEPREGQAVQLPPSGGIAGEPGRRS